MALRPDRIHVDSQIDYFMNEEAERGGIVVQSTVGSGAAMDQASQLCTYSSSPSGVTPLGVLMCDMVDLDLTRQHENWHKEEVQKGGKVTIWSNCTVVTDRVYPGQTPAVNNTVYLAPSGYLATADLIGGNITVGKFLSSKDEDGFCKVKVNLP
jgi:hypothetical protein